MDRSKIASDTTGPSQNQNAQVDIHTPDVRLGGLGGNAGLGILATMTLGHDVLGGWDVPSQDMK